MNKSMLTGLLGGVGLATAGGVAGFVLLGGQPSSTDAMHGTVEPAPVAVVEEPALVVSAPVTSPAPAPAAAVAPAPARAPSPAPVVARPTAAVAQVQTAAVPAPIEERCWDEEVTVQVEPKDENRIAGTAAGALVGGAIAKKVGDDNKLLTVAGAVGGALAGRRIQQNIQENNTTTRIERRCEPAQQQ